MTTIKEFIDLREILRRNTHPAAVHSREIQRRMWAVPGPVWEWYKNHAPYCHQHDDQMCPTEWQ